MQIYIKCNDTVFARMLELELEGRGYGVTDTPEGADAAVIDADVYGEAALPSLPTVFFGRNEPKDSDAFFIHRPFALDKLFELLSPLSRDDKEDIPAVSAEAKRDGIEIKPCEGKVIANGRTISLSDTEYSLFSLLFERRGTPVSRKEISAALFPEAADASNVCDVYIHYLRKKIEVPLGTRLILTLRGKGYMLK